MTGNFQAEDAQFINENEKETTTFESMKVGGHAFFGQTNISGLSALIRPRLPE